MSKIKIILSSSTKQALEQMLAHVLVAVVYPYKDQGPTIEPRPSDAAPADATIADQTLTPIPE